MINAGNILVILGAIDPMEGALLILPGSALIALGTFLRRDERRFLAYRVWVLILIALGVGALFGLSAAGGFGGSSSRSNWWGVLILPYFIGWSMGIAGPGLPRWVPWLGMGVGAWYLTMLAMQLKSSRPSRVTLPIIVIASIGAVAIAGCVSRLMKRTKSS